MPKSNRPQGPVGAKPCPVPADTTKFHELKNRATEAGWSLARISDGQFVVGRWGMSRMLRDLDDVEVFFGRVTGAQS